MLRRREMRAVIVLVGIAASAAFGYLALRGVKLGATRGDQVAIASGVKRGDEVVSSGVFKLRNGAAVLVNNKVRPGNNPKPRPENS